MKNLRILLFAITFLFASNAHSQLIVDGFNLNYKKDLKVIHMIVYYNIFNSEATVRIDYGQKIKWTIGQTSSVINEEGDKIEFNSKIDAINYLERNGWKLFEVDSGGGGDSTTITSYYFRKQEE